MRFLLDESADARLAEFLSSLGHEVTLIARHYPASLRDREVLALAQREERILITNDRDFGELVVKHRQAHTGVIYPRLSSTELADLSRRLREVLAAYPDRLDQFVVVTNTRIRVRRTV